MRPCTPLSPTLSSLTAVSATAAPARAALRLRAPANQSRATRASSDVTAA